jgi:hypothetical protein
MSLRAKTLGSASMPFLHGHLPSSRFEIGSSPKTNPNLTETAHRDPLPKKLVRLPGN